MPEHNLPLACELTPEEIRAQRDVLLPGLLSRASERVPAAEGFRWRFQVSGDLFAAIASTIDAERQCCRFLRFVLTVEPGGAGAVWLEITGPPGTAEFLETVSRM